MPLTPNEISRIEPAVSPDVLRDLHRDLVRQLRGRALGWMAILCLATGSLWALRIRPDPVLLLLGGMMIIQIARSVLAWRSAAHADPVGASASEAAWLERDRERLQAFNERLGARAPIVTSTLAALLVVIAIAEWLMTGASDRAVARAGLVKFLVEDGEWWRLLTATFIHANFGHLAGNTIALMTFGRIVEAFVPRSWLLAAYALAGVTGSLASWWLMPDSASLGASGAIMGVVAFAVVLSWRRRDEFPNAARQRAGMAVLLTAYFGALAFGLIDNAAHAGGAVAGALIGWLALRGTSRIEHAPAWLPLVGVVSIAILGIGAVQTVAALRGGAIVLPAPRQAARAVRSVRADLVRERSVWYVVVTNLSDRVLEAYDIEVANNRTGIWRDECCITSVETGPVPPRGIGRFVVPARPGFRAAGLTVTVAVFEDGSFEGSPALRERVQQRRRDTLAEAEFWLGVLARTPAGTPTQTAAHLERYLSVRASYTDIGPMAMQAFGIPMLVAIGQQKQNDFTAEAERTRARIASARAALIIRLASR